MKWTCALCRTKNKSDIHNAPCTFCSNEQKTLDLWRSEPVVIDSNLENVFKKFNKEDIQDGVLLMVVSKTEYEQLKKR